MGESFSLNGRGSQTERAWDEAIMMVCGETRQDANGVPRPRYSIIVLNYRWFRIFDNRSHRFAGEFYKSPKRALSALADLTRKPKRKRPATVQVLEY
jgi:hypothetical protein